MNRNQPPELPDLGEVVDALRRNARYVVLGIVGVLILLTTYNSYFQVEADEEALILRLGTPTGVAYGPGLHFKLPFIDQVHRANIKKVHQLEFGFRTVAPGVQSEVDNTYRNESLMLTGDLGLVHVQWTVFYRVVSVEKYLFNVRSVEDTIRDVSESTMRLLVGDRSGDEVMTEHREQIASLGQTLMQESMDTVAAGVVIERVALRQLDPPREAQAAFNRVNDARARKQQMIEQAERAMVEATEGALGRKDEIVATARGAMLETVEEARGEAAKFEAFLEAYAEAPDITRKWLYFETMTDVMGKTGRKLFVPGGAGNDLVKLLPLGNLSELAQPARAEAPAIPSGGAR